jgi:hypothetical protein
LRASDFIRVNVKITSTVKRPDEPSDRAAKIGPPFPTQVSRVYEPLFLMGLYVAAQGVQHTDRTFQQHQHEKRTESAPNV